MNRKNRHKIGDAIRQGQQSGFVGREDQLDSFRRQLGLEWNDPLRRYVLNVHGQGGVGKTTLLGEFARAAAATGALAALTDHNEKDAPEAMARLAAGLEQVGGADATLAFSKFSERHATYLKKRGELEADPAAPQGLAGLFGRALVRGGAKVIRNTTPGSDFALSLIEEPLADQAGQWAEYVHRKLGNRDEVQLVLEPAVVLTPLFIKGLDELAAERRIALLFDTYEYTGNFLDTWLRDLLVNAPSELTLVIAGRHELNRNTWSELEHVVARLPLDPFSEDEARDCLARKGVTHEKVIEVILSLSGRLPLLLATLAAESPDDPDRIGDATGTAVERFLKWIDDPARRALALDAALPRRLNRDVVELLGEDAAGFDWLITNPFVQRLPGDGGWACHDVVRAQMLRYKRVESPAGWSALHERLAEYYRAARDGLNREWSQGMSDPDWRAAALGELYHRLCARPQQELATALNGFVSVFNTRQSLAAENAATMAAAGRDAGHHLLVDWGETLGRGLNAYKEREYEMAAGVFTRLADSSLLDTANQAIVFAYRGAAKRRLRQYESALVDLDRAIGLNPGDTWAISSRGETKRMLGRYEDALADLDLVLELGTSDIQAIINRSILYQEMGRYEEALADFSRAIELDEGNAWAITNRGRLYQEMGRYEEALADFSRAIELDEGNAWAIAGRGVTYRLMERYAEALADLDRAIELNKDYAWAIASRGVTHRLMERYAEALADFDRAIELNKDYAWAIASRGLTYRLMERYAEALADFDRAIELNKDYTWAIANRGETYLQLERYAKALADFDRAIELDKDDAWAIARRGETCLQLARYEEALADLNRAVELDKNNASMIASRGLTYRLMERYDEALADFDRAIELDKDDAWAIAHRGETYRLMKRYAEALADFHRAVALKPETDWYLYQRGIIRRRLDPADSWLDDLNAAVAIATAAHQTTPTNLRNLFNLALYHVARGDAEEAESLYREGMAGQPDELLRREAAADLEQYLSLFPDDALAGRMSALLMGESGG